MTEMTMPEVTQGPKKNPWKIILPVAIVLLLCCCIVIVGVLAYMGSQGNGPLAFLQNIIGKSVVGDWYVYYDWGCTGNYSGPASISFLSDGSFSITEGGDPSYGTWTMTGSSIEFIFSEYPNSDYVGTMDTASTSLDGTMTNSDGGNGCWYATR